MATSPVARQPIVAHIQEFRQRLLRVALLFGLGSAGGYLARHFLIKMLQRPLGQSLYYNSPSGGFDFTMRVSMLTGGVFALPVLIHQLVKFIEPAIGSRLRPSRTNWLLIMSIILAGSGLAFAYWFALPMSLRFFAEFGGSEIKPLISASDYLGFVTTCLGTFAVMFQLPLLLLFIDRITPLPPRKLRRYRRHVIIGSLVVAVILPFTYDPLTQFVIAVPIVVLFEVSLLLLWFTNRRLKPSTPPTTFSSRDKDFASQTQHTLRGGAPSTAPLRPLRAMPGLSSQIDMPANKRVFIEEWPRVSPSNVLDLRQVSRFRYPDNS